MRSPDELEADGWVPVHHNGGPYRTIMEAPPCNGVGLWVHSRGPHPRFLSHTGDELDPAGTLQCGRCGGNISDDLQMMISAIMEQRRSV